MRQEYSIFWSRQLLSLPLKLVEKGIIKMLANHALELT
jgi:hypothetical protein